MRGILLSNGALFVLCDNITVRVSPSGKCGISPVSYQVLEWELRTEPPHTWDYVSEAYIRSMDGGVYDKIMEIVTQTRKTLGLSEDE